MISAPAGTVLGAAEDEDGARRWAAKDPNPLNVAVSRARRRLAVVGDYRRWSTLRYFTDAADRLGDHRTGFRRVDGSVTPRRE